MSHAAYPRRTRRRSPLPALAVLAAVAATGWAVLTQPHGQGPVRQAFPPPTQASPPLAAAEPAPAPRPSPASSLAWMLDPTPALDPAAPAFAPGTARGAPPALAFRTDAGRAPTETPTAAREIAATLAAAPVPGRLAAVKPVAPALVPLPVARPPELQRLQVVPAARVAGHRPLPRTRDVFRAAVAEEPSFLESLFGVGRAEAPRQALAYANPDAVPAPRPRLGPAPAPSTSPSAGVAVYDIVARTVTLPGGEVLEAHSGLGAMMDDPRYVHVRMRGSTPPGTYDLTERERLFHGVRAIRLTPVGGSGAIHGRDGLLAHTYMLRQPGASNGCVSFRNYDRFLQAFLRGEVRRLVVVAGGGGDLFGRRIGRADRPDGGA